MESSKKEFELNYVLIFIKIYKGDVRIRLEYQPKLILYVRIFNQNRFKSNICKHDFKDLFGIDYLYKICNSEEKYTT